MTQKELKRLSRSELLELLLIQTKETERLMKKLEEAEFLLFQRELKLEKAGDLAHAVLELNGVMEAAQAAANQYLENMAAMEQKTRIQCQQMLEEARREAERIRNQSGAYAVTSELEEIQDLLESQP